MHCNKKAGELLFYNLCNYCHMLLEYQHRLALILQIKVEYHLQNLLYQHVDDKLLPKSSFLEQQENYFLQGG